MSEEENKQKLSRDQLAQLGLGFQQLLGDESTKKRLLHSLIPTKFAGNSMPYYKPKYAERIRPVIVEMLEDKQPRIVRFEDYPTKSKVTLRLLHQQAIKFLSDNVEGFEGVHRIILCETKRRGILLRYADASIDDDESPIKAYKVSELLNTDVSEQGDLIKKYEEPDATSFPVIISSVQQFLDSGKKGMLKETNLNLSIDEVEHLIELVSSVKIVEGKNLVFSINNHTIGIVRMVDTPSTNTEELK